MKVNERISELRKLMKKNGIDIYYVPNEDEKLAAYKLGQDLVAAAKKLDLE